MFRASSLPIIRSYLLYIRLGSGHQTCMKRTNAECTVDSSWWWVEKMPETCRALWQNKIWTISASSWLFNYEVYHDVRPHEYKTLSPSSVIRYWTFLHDKLMPWLDHVELLIAYSKLEIKCLDGAVCGLSCTGYSQLKTHYYPVVYQCTGKLELPSAKIVKPWLDSPFPHLAAYDVVNKVRVLCSGLYLQVLPNKVLGPALPANVTIYVAVPMACNYHFNSRLQAAGDSQKGPQHYFVFHMSHI